MLTIRISAVSAFALVSRITQFSPEPKSNLSQLDTIRAVAVSKTEFWPPSSPFAKETESPHRRSIGGRCRSSIRAHSLRSNSYAYAKGWDDLVQTFTESLGNSFLDEVILLVHTALPSPPGRQGFGLIRTVSYDALDGVPDLLRRMAPNPPRTCATPVHRKVAKRPYVEVVTGVHPNSNPDRQGQKKRVEMPQEAITDGKKALRDAKPEALTPSQRAAFVPVRDTDGEVPVPSTPKFTPYRNEVTSKLSSLYL